MMQVPLPPFHRRQHMTRLIDAIPAGLTPSLEQVLRAVDLSMLSLLTSPQALLDFMLLGLAAGQWYMDLNHASLPQKVI